MAKTTDYGGQGLNRGNSMHFKKPMKEGVIWGDKANKWLVRVKKRGMIVTIAGYKEKELAEKHYTTLCCG